jgi:NADH-ubiquinone oxidoreductase chain 5
MVTAGVFLIIRSSFLFEAAPYILTFVTLLGTITAFITSTIGLFQFDIKKVIAYSTCSQLGYMVFCCGLSQYNAAIFHLINHAFFKALLFLTAGSIIHSLNGEQDMRKMGQLIKILPSTYNSLITGSFALAGIPFLSGFYSKDFILELAYSHITFHSSIAFWFGSLSAFFTAFYSFRVIFLVFFSKANSPLFYFKNIHEYSLSIGLVLNILTFCSIFFAYFVKDFFIGFGTFY